MQYKGAMVSKPKDDERSWTAKASGTSMLPFMESGAEFELELIPVSAIGVGDIVVFSRPPEMLVAHRVVKIQKGSAPLLFLTKGDNRRSLDAPVSQDKILGRVTRVNKTNIRSLPWRILGQVTAWFSYGEYWLWKSLKDSPVNRLRHRILSFYTHTQKRIRLKKLLFVFAVKQELFAVKIAWVYYFKKRNPKRPFFTLCGRRTGSHLFVSYLNSIAKVSFADEIFSQLQPYGLRRWGVSKKMALRHVRHYLNGCTQTVCGVKFFFSDFQELGISLEDLLKEFPEARWFILYRENMLDQYLSFKLAQCTGEWFRKGALPPNKAKILLDPKDLISYCDKEKSWYEEAQSNAVLRERSLWLSYEELVSDPQGIFDSRVFPFLNISPSCIHTDHLKQNDRSHSKIIANYSKLRAWLEQTNFTHKYVLEIKWPHAAGKIEDK